MTAGPGHLWTGLALQVGTGLNGGSQLGEAALTTMLIAGAIGHHHAACRLL